MAEQPQNEQPQNEEQQIPIDENTAYSMRIMEFNKDISDAKAKAAILEAERDAYTYQFNVDSIIAQHNKIKQQQPEKEKKDEPPAPVADTKKEEPLAPVADTKKEEKPAKIEKEIKK